MLEKINDCEIIKDLLPSYTDGLTNETTNTIIEDHLKDCPGCREKLEKIRNAVASPKQDDQDRAEIEHLEKAGQRSRSRLLIFSLLLAVLLLFGYITLHFLKVGSAYRLSQNQLESLQQQLAQQDPEENDTSLSEYLPEKTFVSLKIFGADRTGDTGFVYAHMYSIEYVKFKDMAISTSGGSFPLKIKVSYTDGDRIHLEETFMPDDGELMEDSMKELFPAWAYLKYEISQTFSPYDYPGLERDNHRQVHKCWGVKVDDDYHIDVLSNGKYQLTKIDDKFGKFETHVEEEGQLQRISKDKKK